MHIGLGLSLGNPDAPVVSWPYDFYADSIRGSNGNPGTGVSPLQTIAALKVAESGFGAGGEYGLFCGSVWREMFAPNNAPALIDGVGDGVALPVIDGADVIDPSAFTPSTHVDAGGVTYEVVLSRDPSGVWIGGDTYMLWESGAWLIRKTSVASVAATPGSFYMPSPVVSSTPAVAYVHPYGTTDPRTDGNVYEYSRRSSGIETWNHTGTVVSDIHIRRGCGAYGTARGGKDADWRRVLLACGGKHNIVAKSGLMSDVIAFDAEVDRKVLLSDNGQLSFTWYDSDPRGYTYRMDRCMCINPVGRYGAGPIYSHGSSGYKYASGQINAFINVRGGTIEFASFSDSLDIEDYVSLDDISLDCIRVPLNSAIPISVNRSLINHSPTTSDGSLITAIAAGAVPGSTFLVQDCCLYAKNSAVTVFGVRQQRPCTANFSHNTMVFDSFANAIYFNDAKDCVVERNIIVFRKTGTNSAVNVAGSTGQPLSIDYNVYCQVLGGIGWRAIDLTWYYSLAAWRAATGFDQHSVVLDAAQTAQLFYGDPATGDFRLNPGCTLTFTDGTPIVGDAGARAHYSWNAKSVVDGPPQQWPLPPASEDQCVQYLLDIPAWDFYP